MIGNKLNKNEAVQYSKSFASIVVDGFFLDQMGISGQEIVTLTPVKQVNFFVLKNLFEQWQEETRKFKSPYFNYKTTEVNQALKNLVNVLSKNILIAEKDFRPLLENAVLETLELLYDPMGYFNSRKENLIASSQLKSDLKYYKIYKSLFEQIANSSSLKNELGEILESFSPSEEEQQAQISAFAQILELKSGLVASKTSLVEEVALPSDDLFASVQDEDEIIEEFEPEERSAVSIENGIANLNEKFAEQDIKTLNQKYEEIEKKKSIAEEHEDKKVDSLSSSISINQRYMFISDLFDGNEGDYNKAIQTVDNAVTFDESVELLVQNYSRKYSWDMNSEEVKNLLKIVFKRFR